jgi:hypothetical protein
MLLTRSSARRAVALCFVLLGALARVALPQVALATTTETYTLSGYEVYFGSDHAVFVGTGSGDGGLNELSGWYTSVYHSLSIDPTGDVTGGYAALQRVDGVEIGGFITGGGATLTDEGDNCTTQTYAITADVSDATRTDEPGNAGTAELDATLTHYRTWILGGCWVYSASISGTVTVTI